MGEEIRRRDSRANDAISGGTVGDCPDAEMIASYVDDKLAAEERARLEEHFASCPDCYSVFTEVVRYQRSETAGVVPSDQADGSSRVIPFTRRRSTLMTMGTLAVAASLFLAVMVLRPDWVPGMRRSPVTPELAELVAAVGEMRPIEPRLTGGFQYGPYRGPVRGEFKREASPDVRIAAARIERAVANNPSAETLHALGVGQIVLGELDAAISTLERAVSESADNARIQSDLAAAYLARAARTSRAEDYTKGLSASELATKADEKLLEAWFNRALAYEGLAKREEARRSWLEYLRVDESSQWAGDAKSRLAALQ